MKEQLAKAMGISEHLREEVDAEKSSSLSLQTQVSILQKWLDNSRDTGLAVASVYIEALKRYGGAAPPMPTEPSAFGIMQWMHSSFSRLPHFFDGIADFAAVSCANNLMHALGEGGCDHVKALKAGKPTLILRIFPGPAFALLPVLSKISLSIAGASTGVATLAHSLKRGVVR